MYFQVASKAARVNLKEMSSAEIKVVASIATHIKPKFFTTSTMNMVQQNSCIKAK
ncbi:hypothetical protein EVA_15557 [gut metagenome]|uniref:Uncharacterized protein n=1 Tax=gut metagenome TaxID=749906 RepID=J9FN17_9ZZZZ